MIALPKKMDTLHGETAGYLFAREIVDGLTKKEFPVQKSHRCDSSTGKKYKDQCCGYLVQIDSD